MTINFHPDRLSGGVTVLESLARDGVYRSQFETGTSSGGLTAHRGGARWHWEKRIFGSAHLRLTEAVLDRSTFCFPDSVFTDEIEATEGGLLDDYVEAHVHGPVELAVDVEALVLDPCFRGSPIEVQAGALGVAVEWHEGRRLTVRALAEHPLFRGPRTVEVGRRIAVAGLLDAAVVGRAAEAGEDDPQDLKKVWHCVARFGAPAES